MSKSQTTYPHDLNPATAHTCPCNPTPYVLCPACAGELTPGAPPCRTCSGGGLVVGEPGDAAHSFVWWDHLDPGEPRRVLTLDSLGMIEDENGEVLVVGRDEVIGLLRGMVE